MNLRLWVIEAFDETEYVSFLIKDTELLEKYS